MLVSTLTHYAYLSHSFRVRDLLAALAFFICLSGGAHAQTYFGGTPQTIDTGVADERVGQFTSQAIVNGFPAISYYDITNGDLMYIRANDMNGTSWGTPVRVDAGGINNDNVGQYTSLAVVNGNPAISYYQGPSLPNLPTDSSLNYVRANVPDGTTGPTPWGTPVTIVANGDVGRTTSLAVVNGRPAIAYYRAGGCSCLNYIRALTSEGATLEEWGPNVRVDTGNATSVGGYVSLVVVNGKPAVSYHDVTNGDLKYARANDEDGVTWGVRMAIDSVDRVGSHTSLAVVNCHSAISYFDQTNGDLKYFRSIPVWSGATSSNWHNDDDWGFGCVPIPGESVLLPATGVTNEAVISNGHVTVTDLTMQTNRILRVKDNKTLTVTGVLTMGGGRITVEPGSKIVLGCQASVVGASASRFIVGDVRKEFCATGSFTFPVGDDTGTAEYSPMTALITAGTFPPTAATPPSLTVSVTDTWLFGLAPAASASRYWTVTEGGDLTADMMFQYLPADVNGDKNGYKVFRSSGGFPTQYTPFMNNPAGNSATAMNVINFSNWGIGTLAPTAAAVNVGGRVVNQDGNGVSGAQVVLADPSGARRIVLTSPFGYFRFEGVQAGQTYIISVFSKRYQFTPQVVNVAEEVADLEFTAQ